jgi:hypothetical protein
MRLTGSESPFGVRKVYDFTEEQVDQGFASWRAAGIDSEQRLKAELLALMNPAQHQLSHTLGSDLAQSLRALAELKFIQALDDVYGGATALRALMIKRLHATLKATEPRFMPQSHP